MKKVPLSEVKDHLSRYLRLAEKQQVVITRHGRPAGVLIGFESEDDWFEYKLENDPKIRSFRAGGRLTREQVHDRNALRHEQAVSLTEAYLRFPVQETTVGLMEAALQSSQRYRISYWDAAII